MDHYFFRYEYSFGNIVFILKIVKIKSNSNLLKTFNFTAKIIEENIIRIINIIIFNCALNILIKNNAKPYKNNLGLKTLILFSNFEKTYFRNIVPISVAIKRENATPM